MSYLYDKYIFHYVVENGLTYLCMTDGDFKRVFAFTYLEEIKSRFVATYGERAKQAAEFAYQTDFHHTLRKQADKYISLAKKQDDKVQQVQAQVNQVKDVVMGNIDAVLQNREKIEVLVERTEDLNFQSAQFGRQSRSLKRALCFKNAKIMLTFTLLGVVTFYSILASACGGVSLPKC